MCRGVRGAGSKSIVQAADRRAWPRCASPTRRSPLPSRRDSRQDVVKVTTSSAVARDLSLAEYTSADATFDAANAYFNEYFSTGTPPAGDAPATINGGLGGIAPGASGYFEVDLSNGRVRPRQLEPGARRQRSRAAAHRLHRRLSHSPLDEQRARAPARARSRVRQLIDLADEVEHARRAAGHLDRRQQLVDDARRELV